MTQEATQTYPLEVISMDDLGYFSFGHHDTALFAQAANELELREYGVIGVYDEFRPDEPEHVWWKEVPSTGRFDVEYRRCDPDDEDAIPVTVIYI